MGLSERIPIRCLLLVFLLTCLAQSVSATAVSFGVESGEEATKTLRLAVEDHVFFHFTVTGGQSESTVWFSMTCPNQTVKDFGRVGGFEHRFTCDSEGDYVLHFSNVGQSETKFITLDYEIQHYILGLPQMLFVAIVVVVFCLGGVAVFVLMGKPH